MFSLPDPRRALRRVALLHELVRPRDVEFERSDGGFELELPRPPVDRLEYLLAVEGRDGDTQVTPDPANPLQADGPFGPKSVVEFPEYAPPEWLADEESTPGELREVGLPGRLDVTAFLWSAADTDPAEPLPLLLVHDGPEYAEYCSLLRLFDHLVAFGEVPPFRAALLPPPGNRNETYSASARYARTLVGEWLPALRPVRPAARSGSARASARSPGCTRTGPTRASSAASFCSRAASSGAASTPRRPPTRASRASPASCRACSAAVARSSGSR